MQLFCFFKSVFITHPKHKHISLTNHLFYIFDKEINMFHKHPLSLAIYLIGFGITPAWADSLNPPITLDTLAVVINTTATASLLDSTNISDITIKNQTLKQRGINLGDALAGELGIHASQFGGGSSAPIIRGQTGKRIKILNNGNETLDMSAMSPDHAITTDSMLAEQIEIVRGTNTLLYSLGNSAGVVNVVDNKIPNSQPTTFGGDAGMRVNSTDKERLIYATFEAPLGKNFALHLEGMQKKTDDYQTPKYLKDGQFHHKLADSFSNSQSGSIGIAWIGKQGHLGMSVSERNDRYGLPAHTHLYEKYFIDIIPSKKTWWFPERGYFGKPYLKHYPFLMEETDIDYNNPGIKCIKGTWHAHSHLCEDDHGHHHDAHDNPTKNHHHQNPHIDLHTKRIDVRGEWKRPVPAVDKIKFNASHADYHHNEKTGSIVDNTFKNKGKNLRLEVLHLPIDLGLGVLTGAVGIQHLQQSSHALDTHALSYRRQHLLQDHTTTQNSLFWLQKAQWSTWQFNLGARLEHQKITLDFNQNLSDYPDEDAPNELKEPRKDTARSYALGAIYMPNDIHQLSFNLSHQERLPNAQELYAHGKHLATNSFDTGNKNLTKEKSINAELAYEFTGGRLDAKIATYYNDFNNYIYLATLNNGKCSHGRRCSRSLDDAYSLRINRYNQSKAIIYGVEGKIGYQFTPNYYASIFGDYVRGKLYDLPSLPIGYDYYGNPTGYRQQPDGNAPRIPAARLGVRLKNQITKNLSTDVELYHVFDQNKVAILENPTKGHAMLNMEINYKGKVGNQSYTVFTKASNFLNTKAYNHSSFLPYIPQSGRSISTGIHFKF